MAANNPSFIFHDPSGRRWVRFRQAATTSAILLGLFLAVVVLIALTEPQLPTLGFPAVQTLASLADVPAIVGGQKLKVNVPFRMTKPLSPVRYVRSASPVLHPRPAAKSVGGAPLVWGFYVNWDPNSIVSLRLHLGRLTHLVPEWLTLNNANGDIDDQSDPTVLAIAQQASLPVIALLTNYRDGWRPKDVSKVLNDPKRTANLIANIRANLEEHKFAGINIDFEDFGVKDREPLVRFMRQLTDDLHKDHYIVSEDLPADDFDIVKRIAPIVDYVVPMIYDEHYQSGEPGPVASQAFFEEQLDKLAKAAPPAKLIAGFGNYGYDWTIGGKGGTEATFDDVMVAATESKSPVQWDPQTLNPVLRYTAAGKQHEVWFLDAVSGLNQVLAARDDGYRGVGLWRLGAEDPGLWNVLLRESWPADKFDTASLQTMQANQQAPRHVGEGEILHIAEQPHAGNRKVIAPRTEQDYFGEQYIQPPSPWVVSHTGSNAGKVLCLTFDDGPDPHYTPQILDILKSRGVPATFFVIGVNAENNPDLIRREYREGHQTGNHTYTHPNVALISAERTELELGTTQRILENLLGVSTVLFRPPYNADSEPQTPEEIVPIDRAQGFGYTTVAETIDPRDWVPNMSTQAIVDEIDNEIGNGHVILLHDAGGNRDATVRAVPQIIDRYRKQGYRFVTIGELMGKSRADVMPAPGSDEMRLARIEGQTLDTRALFAYALGLLFLGAIYLTVARSLIYGCLAILQKRKEARTHYDDSFQPPVSVLIAAYNEEKVIARTVESILQNGYPNMEIIVVDDGSKDRTFAVLHEHFGNHPAVRLLSQPNGGKSAALNNAIGQATHRILIAVDADTLFRPGTISKLARHFKDPRVGAVSGNARVGNRNNWVTRFQCIEYVYGFNLDRRALDLLNAITVVPGAVGAWRKDLVEAAGCFGHDTLAEDADLTLAIRRMGNVIRYEQDAIAYTEAPEDTASLAKQRFRWSFGTLQAAWKHRDAMFVPKYGTLGFVALPAIWIFQILLSTLSPFAEIAMFLALIAGNWKTVLAYYMAFFLFEVLTGVLAYALEGIPAWDLQLLFFQRVYYRQLMLYVLAKSLLFAVRGRLVGWGKLERTASVSAN